MPGITLKDLFLMREVAKIEDHRHNGQKQDDWKEHAGESPQGRQPE
jgi:hypothetical protein